MCDNKLLLGDKKSFRWDGTQIFGREVNFSDPYFLHKFKIIDSLFDVLTQFL